MKSGNWWSLIRTTVLQSYVGSSMTVNSPCAPSSPKYLTKTDQERTLTSFISFQLCKQWFMAQMLQGLSKWLTQMIYIKHDRVKNPNWQDSIRWPIHYHRWGVKLGTKRSGRNLDQSYWMRVQRSYRSTKLPASRGGGGREKRERVEGEKKRVPFSLPFFPSPPPPLLPMLRRLQLPVYVWYCPPNDFFVTFIQDWVYKQICCCTTPLHPLVAPLLEAFVHSVINPVSSKSSKHKETAFTLHGFTDAEVMSVFAPDQQVCVIFSMLWQGSTIF